MRPDTSSAVRTGALALFVTAVLTVGVVIGSTLSQSTGPGTRTVAAGPEGSSTTVRATDPGPTTTTTTPGITSSTTLPTVTSSTPTTEGDGTNSTSRHGSPHHRAEQDHCYRSPRCGDGVVGCADASRGLQWLRDQLADPGSRRLLFGCGDRSDEECDDHQTDHDQRHLVDEVQFQLLSHRPPVCRLHIPSRQSVRQPPDRCQCHRIR